MSSKASPTTIAVSTMNMEKMLLPEAPLHLCTPMALARCVSEATGNEYIIQCGRKKQHDTQKNIIQIIFRT